MRYCAVIPIYNNSKTISEVAKSVTTKLSSQMSPELTAINEKYKGKTDEASRRKMQMLMFFFSFIIS